MKKLTALLLCVLLLIPSFASVANAVEYPMESLKITYMAPENAHVLAVTSNWQETPFVQAWREKTGIDLQVSYFSDFNLLVASGEYPDIITGSWNSYAGGIDRAIEDGVIIPVDEYLAEHAPDYLAALESEEAYMKQARTAQGYIPGFYMLRSKPALNSYGMIVRSDWLDKLGMEVPTTKDEFYNMLVAFRDQMGATVPFSVTLSTLKNIGNYGLLTSSFGLANTAFYHVDGKICYGPMQPEYKDYLTWLNQLYVEGLLDKNVLTLDTNTQNSNIMNNLSGVLAGYGSGGMGNIMTTMKSVNPEFQLAGMPSLVLNEGDRALFGQRSDSVAQLTAITSACKNVEAAVEFLNWGYTEEGRRLMYYGVEGISYEVIDGYPYFTDYVKNNPDGLPFAQALSQYDYSPANGPFLANGDYSIQTYSDAQKNALKVWQDNDCGDHYVATVIGPAPEYADEYSFIKSEVDTYVSENFALFITGERSLDEFDAYLDTLKSMNVDRMVEIYQAAFDAFNK